MSITSPIVRALLCCALSTALWGQTDVGRIIGAVTDASGAVVAGATVKVQDERTNAARTVTTNESGAFVMTQLRSSTYKITASFPNFADAVMSGVALQVGQERNVSLSLQAETVTTEVTVSSGGLANVDT